MSIDKSLKPKSALSRHRNVLTRAERIDKMKEEDRWEEERSVFALPKVIHRKVSTGGKEKKKKEETTEATAETPKAESKATS